MNPKQPSRGFALLITITLLAFLVLLLVSLASLTRVETQVAGNSQQLSLARQNALLALNIALGQLQAFAGSDQRITAPADLIATKDKAGLASPAPAAATLTVQDGSRYWTGVWGNGQSSIGYDLRPDQINGRGVTPVQLNWLISGNEATTYTANGTAGGVTEGTGAGQPLFLPDGAVANLPGATASSTDITIQNRNGASHAATLLVGPNSVGSAATLDYVAAPLMDITAPAGSVPGLSTGAVIGRYAWWVGDEGVKARINLRHGYQQTGAATDQINSFLVSQRAALERMDRDNSGNAIGADYDFANTQIPRILTAGQLPLVGATALAQTHLTSAAQTRFHDLTTRSQGVLADTYTGGLKKDLTADIADTSSNSSYRPVNTDPLFTPLSNGEANLPTWGHLRTWARTHPDNTGAVAPVPPSDTEAGFGPILLYASVGLDVWVDSANAIRIAFFPVAVLSNPYPVAISPANYDLGFRFPAGASVYLQTAEPAATPAFTTAATFDLGGPSILPGQTAGTQSNYISFTIQGSVIPAGETHIYRLDSTEHEKTYAPGRLMTRAPNDDNIELTNRLLLPSSFTLPATVTDEHYLRVRSYNISRNNDRLEVALSTPGSLGTGSGQYQIADVLMSDRGIATDGYNLINPTGPAIANNWDIDNGSARTAIRFGSPLEGRSDYSALGRRFGLPEQPVSWLRHGNRRAPVALATTLETGASSVLNRTGATLVGALLVNTDTITPSAHQLLLYPYKNNHTINLAGTLDAGTNGGKRPPYHATLFDVLDSSERLLSLGQLQNAPLSRYIFNPAYPFGNSMADMRVDRLATYRGGVVLRPGTASTFDPAYDLSWHLNRALWDRYFVSGVPSTLAQTDIGSNTPLPNARINYYRKNGQDPDLSALKASAGNHTPYDQASAHLLVSGAFNINSTSEQAWRAVLAGSLNLPTHTDYVETGDNVSQIAPYARISHNLSRPANAPYPALSVTMKGDTVNENTFRETLYHGNRGLSLKDSQTSTNTSAEAVIAELARTIVHEIRLRGPFLSLSDFVNRPIYSNKKDAGIKGALQSAIDTMEPTAAQANPYARWKSIIGGTPTATQITNVATNFPGWDAEHYLGGPASELGTNREAFSFFHAFAPKYLTQADLLSTLGPQLTARSDTFTIRTYGETANPVTTNVESRAWCEAVVQRLPDYVDDSTDAWAAPAGTNLTFGRRFKIVSFRWLTPQDI
ncbi:MAG: hypothetical protein WC205_07145 [Opitutaceae bacterium]|jgi:hypothetical protein